MLERYLFVCLLLSVVANTLSISLDYYFGSDDTAVRSVGLLENCYTDKGEETCQERCGNNHACLLGKCFCVELKPRIKYKVLQALGKAMKYSSYKEPSLKSENHEGNPIYMTLKNSVLRPSLRHHIAHFCPNLGIARKCIAKCMKQGKAAFCGKDHTCYCGHKYGNPSDANDDFDSSENGPYDDLYEKYFGPRN